MGLPYAHSAEEDKLDKESRENIKMLGDNLDTNNREIRLLQSIENNDINEIHNLLNMRIDLNQYNGEKSDIYLYNAIDDGHWDIAKLLIKYGAKVYSSNGESTDHLNDAMIWVDIDTDMVRLLLEKGANPNYAYKSENNLSYLTSRIIESDINYNLFKILLEFGGRYQLNKKVGLCNCSALSATIAYAHKVSIIQLLLNNGADPAIPDEYGDSMLSILSRYKEKYTQEDYNKAAKILNPNNPAYLKLGENEEDKYIIYENKKTDEEYEIYLLVDKKKLKEKNTSTQTVK